MDPYDWYMGQTYNHGRKNLDQRINNLIADGDLQYISEDDISDLVRDFPEYQDYLNSPNGWSINQIKGPGNRAPDPDVIPYLQEFVKEGKWSDVRDLYNAGLYKLDDGTYGNISDLSPAEANKLADDLYDMP
jgi:hypothetical protein